MSRHGNQRQQPDVDDIFDKTRRTRQTRRNKNAADTPAQQEIGKSDEELSVDRQLSELGLTQMDETSLEEKKNILQALLASKETNEKRENVRKLQEEQVQYMLEIKEGEKYTQSPSTFVDSQRNLHILDDVLESPSIIETGSRTLKHGRRQLEIDQSAARNQQGGSQPCKCQGMNLATKHSPSQRHTKHTVASKSQLNIPYTQKKRENLKMQKVHDVQRELPSPAHGGFFADESTISEFDLDNSKSENQDAGKDSEPEVSIVISDDSDSTTKSDAESKQIKNLKRFKNRLSGSETDDDTTSARKIKDHTLQAIQSKCVNIDGKASVQKSSDNVRQHKHATSLTEPEMEGNSEPEEGINDIEGKNKQLKQSGVAQNKGKALEPKACVKVKKNVGRKPHGKNNNTDKDQTSLKTFGFLEGKSNENIAKHCNVDQFDELPLSINSLKRRQLKAFSSVDSEFDHAAPIKQAKTQLYEAPTSKNVNNMEEQDLYTEDEEENGDVRNAEAVDSEAETQDFATSDDITMGDERPPAMTTDFSTQVSLSETPSIQNDDSTESVESFVFEKLPPKRPIQQVSHESANRVCDTEGISTSFTLDLEETGHHDSNKKSRSCFEMANSNSIAEKRMESGKTMKPVMVKEKEGFMKRITEKHEIEIATTLPSRYCMFSGFVHEEDLPHQETYHCLLNRTRERRMKQYCMWLSRGLPPQGTRAYTDYLTLKTVNERRRFREYLRRARVIEPWDIFADPITEGECKPGSLDRKTPEPKSTSAHESEIPDLQEPSIYIPEAGGHTLRPRMINKPNHQVFDIFRESHQRRLLPKRSPLKARNVLAPETQHFEFTGSEDEEEDFTNTRPLLRRRLRRKHTQVDNKEPSVIPETQSFDCQEDTEDEVDIVDTNQNFVPAGKCKGGRAKRTGNLSSATKKNVKSTKEAANEKQDDIFEEKQKGAKGASFKLSDSEEDETEVLHMFDNESETQCRGRKPKRGHPHADVPDPELFGRASKRRRNKEPGYGNILPGELEEVDEEEIRVKDNEEDDISIIDSTFNNESAAISSQKDSQASKLRTKTTPASSTVTSQEHKTVITSNVGSTSRLLGRDKHDVNSSSIDQQQFPQYSVKRLYKAKGSLADESVATRVQLKDADDKVTSSSDGKILNLTATNSELKPLLGGSQSANQQTFIQGDPSCAQATSSRLSSDDMIEGYGSQGHASQDRYVQSSGSQGHFSQGHSSKPSGSQGWDSTGHQSQGQRAQQTNDGHSFAFHDLQLERRHIRDGQSEYQKPLEGQCPVCGKMYALEFLVGHASSCGVDNDEIEIPIMARNRPVRRRLQRKREEEILHQQETDKGSNDDPTWNQENEGPKRPERRRLQRKRVEESLQDRDADEESNGDPTWDQENEVPSAEDYDNLPDLVIEDEHPSPTRTRPGARTQTARRGRGRQAQHRNTAQTGGIDDIEEQEVRPSRGRGRRGRGHRQQHEQEHPPPELTEEERGECFICGAQVPKSELQVHVNACLDQQG